MGFLVVSEVVRKTPMRRLRVQDAREIAADLANGVFKVIVEARDLAREWASMTEGWEAQLRIEVRPSSRE